MGNTESTPNSVWSITFTQIKSKHDNAFIIISEGISLEEQGQQDEALEKYKHGIDLIDQALSIEVTCPENPDFSWEKACVMVQKMKKTRAEILSRITALQPSPTPSFEMIEAPPSYDEAVGSTPPNTPQTYSDLAQALRHVTVDSSVQIEPEIVYICEGVRLYFISPGGEVSSTMRPQTLKITLVENEGPDLPRAILQVGDWIYPLIPGVSPCYRADFGAFILPNVYAETPNSSIGIILPSDADKDTYEILENILYGIVGEGKPPETEGPDLSEKISSGIINGANYLSYGLVKGAEKVGQLLNDNTPKIINRIPASDQPAQVPAGVAKSMQVAECATSKAAQVTGFVAEQVGIATVKLGRFLAPHIQKHGTRLLTSGFRMSEQTASQKVKNVITVAAGAVEGFSTVYRGLESSASILGESLKNNTVKIVHHKYGQPAAHVTGDTLSTVGNVIQISHNAKIIKPKNLAKRTAKEAGKAVVYSYGSNFDRAGPSSEYPEKSNKLERI